MALLKVKTKSGWVEGLPSGNQAVSLFKGIPFAAPPVGGLRWKAPQPVKPWDEVRQAFRFADIPIQERMPSEGGNSPFYKAEFHVVDFPMNEDCLYINIWTPANSDKEKLPVAVYIHGGAMRAGYSYLQAYDGDGFAKRGIVFVSIAYRLNVFGFLAHPKLTAEDNHHSSGNYALLDQVAALVWIKENIAAFGGDPDNISIFGQSAGGMGVRYMSVTPLTKGLFKHCAIQSGGGMLYPALFSDWPLEDSEKQGKDFLEFIGAKTIEAARNLSAQEILRGLSLFDQKVSRFRSSAAVDGYFLQERECEAFRNGRHHDIDYLVGCTKAEMSGSERSLPTLDQIRAEARQIFGGAADRYLQVVRPEDVEFYNQEIHQCMFTDEMLAGAWSICENQNKVGRKPCYMYYFTQSPPGYATAFHSSEHHYVFQTFIRSRLPYSGRDFDLSNTMADYWFNFFKSGNPNGLGLPVWEPYTAEKPKAMNLCYECHMDYLPEKPIVKFLKEFAVNG